MAVRAAWLLAIDVGWWCNSLGVPCFGGERSCRGENLAWFRPWPTVVVSVDIIPFLKAPLRQCFAIRNAPGENLDPWDRAVTVLRCRVLPEDTALEAPFRRCSASSLRDDSFTVEGSVDFRMRFYFLTFCLLIVVWGGVAVPEHLCI